MRRGEECHAMSGVDRVYLARHGRTALNADGRLRGLPNPPLDTVGQAEAQRLADALACYTPTVVITSPLQRAVSTAQAIGAASRIAVVVDKRLTDRDYGPWTGRSRAALLRTLDPALEGVGQRTACYNQLSRVGERWRVDFYDRKPQS
jgi:broad specificity phosphatase PhoE